MLVPVLKRPHRVKPLLDSLERTTDVPFRVVFVCDPDDHQEIQAVVAQGDRCTRMVQPGSYATKINLAAGCVDEPRLFLGADDLHFHPGWYEAAEAKLEEGAQVVGVNDLMPRDRRHATHFLITRDYADQPTSSGERGPLFEGYHHWFCDDELIYTATRRGLYAYADDSLVEHLHYVNGKAPDDEVYAKGRLRWREDRKLFRKRRRSL